MRQNLENRQPKTKKACIPLVYKGLQALCIGRHDWTRTNDPYHVKVVL
jgi:hypothetical protein